MKIKNKEPEFIALSAQNKKFAIKNIFTDDLKVNHKKQDIKIFDDEKGFTYIEYKGRKYLAEISSKVQNKYTVLINGVSYSFTIESPISFKRKKYLDKQKSNSKIEVVEAPMPGKILDVMVEPGAEVKTGEAIIILEAMKMQNEILSPINGKVSKVLVRAGDTVNKDDIMVEIDR